MSLDQFFADAERRAADLGDDERSRMPNRLKCARRLIGDVDALERLRTWKSPEER